MLQLLMLHSVSFFFFILMSRCSSSMSFQSLLSLLELITAYAGENLNVCTWVLTCCLWSKCKRLQLIPAGIYTSPCMGNLNIRHYSRAFQLRFQVHILIAYYFIQEGLSAWNFLFLLSDKCCSAFYELVRCCEAVQAEPAPSCQCCYW